MRSIYGENLKLTIFGQSHGPSVGMTLEGIPAGLPVDMQALQAFLDRRAPGRSDLVSARKEPDVPQFQSGILNGRTDGQPITAIIPNLDARPGDYAKFADCPRPGHADYTARVKYGEHLDLSGGGHFSGRLTAPMCIAGGLGLQWLAKLGIFAQAKLIQVGKCQDPAGFEAEIRCACSQGDSVGGIIECMVLGLPAGLGEPMFGGMENRIAQIVFGIPGIKGIEFGSGFAGSSLRGSENNDPYCIENGLVRTKTNHCGGILGGITNGMPLVFRMAVKPTASIAMAQESISLSRMEPQTLRIGGRHDPCIALRALPVAEAAAAIAVLDAMLADKGESLWN